MKKDHFHTTQIKFPIHLVIALLAVLWSSTALAQQQTFEIDPEQPAEVTIVGGSTLHDWTVTCGAIEDYPTALTVTLEEEHPIPSFSFSVQVKSMEGGRGSIMNNKIFAALKAEEHPQVIYQQTSPAAISTLDEEGKFLLTSTGSLQMAGQEKAISVEVAGQIQEGILVFTGSHPLKLSDFQIDPPSAMFGQIQTKDDITINFEFRYLLND